MMLSVPAINSRMAANMARPTPLTFIHGSFRPGAARHFRRIVSRRSRTDTSPDPDENPGRANNRVSGMHDEDQLEQLSSKELHDLAVSRAKRHLDVRFFWRLMELLPVAEAAAGELKEAEADVDDQRAYRRRH